MHISNLRRDSSPAHRIDGVSPVREDSRLPGACVEHRRAGGDDVDSVDISDEALVRAAGADTTVEVPFGTLPAERLTELRCRIADRAHDSDLMADAVMRRIAESGALR